MVVSIDRRHWTAFKYHTRFEFTDLAAAHNITSYHKLKIKFEIRQADRISYRFWVTYSHSNPWNIQKGDRMECVLIRFSSIQHLTYINSIWKQQFACLIKMHIWKHWLSVSKLGSFSQSQCFWCVSKFNF